MRKLFILLCVVTCTASLTAQQEDQFTQFMYYKMGYNPGAAGSDGATTITALVRSQWIGLDGAPETQLVNFSMPLLNQRIGVGGSIVRSTIGFSERYAADAVYAYRIPMGRGTLGIGVQASVRLFRLNFRQARGVQPINMDNAVPAGIRSQYTPNFGAGVYYNSDVFYIGFSIPRLLQNNIDLSDEEGTISRELRHFYAMGGLNLKVSDEIRLQPQVLLKYVKNAPFDADVNVNALFMDRFTAGFSYRIGGSKENGLGESLAVLLGAEVTENIMFGVSYDATLSELRNYSSGTVEGVFRYRIQGKAEGEEFDNGRIFF